MNPDKIQVKKAFNKAAETYNASAVLQKEIGERMLSRLDYIKLSPEIILDAGSGTGVTSVQVKKRYPDSTVIELDFAHSMLAQSKNPWWQFFHKKTQVCGDIEKLPLKKSSIDMLWSNLALQWCDIELSFAQFYQALKPGGLLLFSTFGPDTLKEIKYAFAGIDEHSHINRFVDLHDIGDSLVRTGFSNPVIDMEVLTLTYEDVKSVMKDLKSIGANTTDTPKGLMGKEAWRKMIENYENLRKDGRLPATFEVLYGHAWKPEEPKFIRIHPAK